MDEPNIWIVQKKTALERYTNRAMNMDFFDYLERAGQSLQPLVHAHSEHTKTRTKLTNQLKSAGVSYKIINLDELAEKSIEFYSSDKPESGLRPTLGIVLSLGGDGTLLHTSHFVGDHVWLVGINSCPEHSVGHLCGVLPHEIDLKIPALLEKSVFPTQVRRLKISASAGITLPLALNDILITNQHPAATSRYQISIVNKNPSEEVRIEKHLSSGLWVSTAAGSTAAISSYGLPHLPLNSSNFHFAVREPYTPLHQNDATQSPRLLSETLEGNTTTLRFFSRMRQGMICVDGPDSSADLGFGEAVEISLPEEAALHLVRNFPGKESTVSKKVGIY